VDLLTYVDLETARAARGVRMAVASALPSPWSEAAKALFHVKQIPALAVRFLSATPELEAWTGSPNVPVVLRDDDPPRTGWAEIIALGEELGGRVPLVPADLPARALMFELVAALAGQDGLAWSNRLLMIDGGMRSEGREGFPLPVARYLAPKYGYTSGCAAHARARVAEVLGLLDRTLAGARAAGHRYLLGDALTALDLYAATFLTPIAGVTEAECPEMRPRLRPAFTYVGREVGEFLSAELAAHRRFVFDQHLGWPIVI
jgi:glutathione S-transferase